jgi:hypothetical protein
MGILTGYVPTMIFLFCWLGKPQITLHTVLILSKIPATGWMPKPVNHEIIRISDVLIALICSMYKTKCNQISNVSNKESVILEWK